MPPLRRLLGTTEDEAERIFAVFRQETKNDAHVHVGDVHAPDAGMALVLAKEQFARRDPCVSLWVVPYSAVESTTEEDEEMFAPATDKSYRFGGSYREQQRVYGRTPVRSPQPDRAGRKPRAR